jgi:adenylate cyclase
MTGSGPEADSGAGAAPDLGPLVEAVEQRLLGGPRRHTRAEVAEATGLAPDSARALWRALGFATVADDERAFTDDDVAALRRVVALTEILRLDDDSLRAITRMLGRTFARLASWQGRLVSDQLANSPELLQSGEDVLAVLDRMLDTMQDLQAYVWRRQLAAYFSRLAASGADAASEHNLAVGFADMAQFTAATRRWSETDLREVLEAFEAVATDVIGAHSGQIVKTIGDEVFFAADEPGDAAEIALELLAAAEADERLPALRVGLAAGPVVSRLGDVFGQTVNIASRLTSLARADSVLVDQGMAAALEADERYVLHPLRPASVRGYHHLRSWRLRRR